MPQPLFIKEISKQVHCIKIYFLGLNLIGNDKSYYISFYL
jgi:hypothetical protein